jgi:hypothetical protein
MAKKSKKPATKSIKVKPMPSPDNFIRPEDLLPTAKQPQVGRSNRVGAEVFRKRFGL